MFSSEHIHALLEPARQEGWAFTVHQKPKGAPLSTLQFIAHKDEESFELVVTSNWISVNTLFPFSATEKELERLCVTLLQLHHDFFLARFSMGPDGNIYLRIDQPEYKNQANQFRHALDAILRYKKQTKRFFQGQAEAGLKTLFPSRNRDLQELTSHRLSDDQIKDYFKRLRKDNWQVSDEKLSDQSWLAYYFHRDRTYNVYFTFTTGWTYFQVLLNELPPFQETNLMVPAYLMKLNDRIYWAKYNLLPVGAKKGIVPRIVLTLDFPSEEFRFTLFRQAALTLAHYLNAFSREILLLSVDAALARLADTNVPQPEWFISKVHAEDEIWAD